MKSIVSSLTVLGLTLVAIGCGSLPPRNAHDTLAITVSVEAEPSGGDSKVVAVFANQGSSPIAFTRTFGYGAYAWIGVLIRDEEGTVIPYPVEADLFEQPSFECLYPGESLRWSLDPKSWRFEVSGERVGESLSFDLPPGAYTVQVLYSGGTNLGGRKCAPIVGLVRSDPVSLVIR